MLEESSTPALDGIRGTKYRDKSREVLLPLSKAPGGRICSGSVCQSEGPRERDHLRQVVPC